MKLSSPALGLGVGDCVVSVGKTERTLGPRHYTSRRLEWLYKMRDRKYVSEVRNAFVSVPPEMRVSVSTEHKHAQLHALREP